ncbi:hypothetical protein Ddye_025820 [Dipteronia dyeriana]|uniref:Peptidase A2 domain-containing protein n=1 Tax=Dipteronia dyeriana TaxID=168575 RepID=A0AAD9WPY6_9ROSI|nr:hypothetical protein Ddye_025820 [Dipteronia dyeriana]
MWVFLEINGKILNALLDIGSSRNLLAKTIVDKLGIQPHPCSGEIQGLNGTPTSVDGLLDVNIRIGKWSGACTLLVLPLDNIDCILGMYFFVANKVTLTPHLDGVPIGERNNHYYVQAGFDCDKEWPVRFQELTVPK